MAKDVLLRLAAAALASIPLAAVPVAFTQLTGLTGGSIAGTAVYRADLSTLGLGTISSITIEDSNSGIGGSEGAFSGFDLDAVILSNTLCATSACAQGLAGLPVFNYGAAIFVAGTQRAPVAPRLTGTTPAGTAVDDAEATLGAFDGESTTGGTIFRFLSMGDGGRISLNLSSAVSTTGLYLYIGEAGDNGEVASSNITVSPDRVPDVPEPTTVLVSAIVLGSLALRRARSQH
jgi:hypothetical protein